MTGENTSEICAAADVDFFEHLPVLTVRTTVDGSGSQIIDDCNERFADRLGRPRSELIGLSASTLYAPDMTPPSVESQNQSKSDPRAKSATTRQRGCDHRAGINRSTDEQARAAGEATTMVEDVAATSQQTAADSEEAAETTEAQAAAVREGFDLIDGLSEQADTLSTTLGKTTVDDSAGQSDAIVDRLVAGDD